MSRSYIRLPGYDNFAKKPFKIKDLRAGGFFICQARSGMPEKYDIFAKKPFKIKDLAGAGFKTGCV
jgi:hypothetical protein